MHRIFLGLAITDGTLLGVTFGLGFAATGAVRGPGSWYGIHFLLGLLSSVVTLLVHSIVYTYFLGTARWVKEVAEVYKLPAWLHLQALKNKRRVFPFVLWGMLSLGAASWLGAGADRFGWPLWAHTALSAAAMAFNLAAFALEYTVIVAQARLLLEVKAQADRLREAQLAARAAVADL